MIVPLATEMVCPLSAVVRYTVVGPGVALGVDG